MRLIIAATESASIACRTPPLVIVSRRAFEVAIYIEISVDDAET